MQSNTCLIRLHISYVMPEIINEEFQKNFLSPMAFCKLIELITAPNSKSKLLVFIVPDCYMKDVDACRQVQIGLKRFASRRGYPLQVVRDSLFNRRSVMSRDSLNQLKESSLPQSLLFGNV